MEPATLAELKQKFPNSTADWREKQLEANATLVDAAVNYAAFADEQRTKERQAHEKELAAQKEKAEKDLEAAKSQSKGSRSLGHDPIVVKENGGDFLEAGDDAVDDFNNAVAKLAGPNATYERRQQAIRQVARKNPQLYQAYLLGSNKSTKQLSRLITEKLELTLN